MQHRERTGGNATQQERPSDTKCVCVCESRLVLRLMLEKGLRLGLGG